MVDPHEVKFGNDKVIEYIDKLCEDGFLPALRMAHLKEQRKTPVDRRSSVGTFLVHTAKLEVSIKLL